VHCIDVFFSIAVVHRVLHLPDDVREDVCVHDALLDRLLPEVATDRAEVEVGVRANLGAFKRRLNHLLAPGVLVEAFAQPVLVHDGNKRIVLVGHVVRRRAVFALYVFRPGSELSGK